MSRPARTATAALAAAFVLSAVAPSPAAAQQTPGAVPTPASYFGFEPGTDGRLADWDALVGYYRALADASDRVAVRDLGETTLGNPFLLVTISSPENLANAERLAEISRALADPRGLDDARVERLVAEGKSVVAATAGLHSTEVAPPQMAPGLAYRLATEDSPATRRVLDETVFLLFPCFNPDGTEMVVDWVDRTRGTEYEGAYFPDLYHHYAGHDNNRDAYALNLAESRMFADVVYREWVPQLYLDVHQMGSYGARLYVPPYADPINPNVDPLVWMEHELVGANMQVALERAGVTGVVAGAPYSGWWFPSFHMVTNHHNIAGMLTETASAKMAWPLYIHPHQLEPEGRRHEVYGPMQLFPHPWEGGWWRLKDLIHQEHVSTYAMLETAAKNRELLLRNMVFKARRTIERAGSSAPYAYVVPADRHDPLTVDKLVATLIRNGIEVGRATEDFVQDGRAFAAGDYIVSTAQPNGVLVKSLLGEAHYPDNAVTRRADGTIFPPYDMANFVLAEHMGVRAVPVETPVEVASRTLTEAPRPRGVVTDTAGAGWLVSHAVNDAFRVTNRILADGGGVYWLKEPIERDGHRFGPGALWIPDGELEPADVASLAAGTGVDFVGVADAPTGAAWRLRPLRLGVYRGPRGNMDEGWTRLLFDRWGFPYERVRPDALRDGALDDLDVFLFPRESLRGLMAADDPRGTGAAEGEPEEYPDVFLPPEYRDGLDDAAISRLRDWVRAGGTLVLLDDAAELAIEEFGVPVDDAVAGLPDTAFFSPGSNLRARFDVSHPLAYGMPEEALILNWGSPVFEIERTQLNERIAAPIAYVEDEADLLRSGWLLGGRRIAGRPAALDVEYGEGRVLMIGFRAQHRAQTHGTFKVFFNALYYGSAQEVELGTRVAER